MLRETAAVPAKEVPDDLGTLWSKVVAAVGRTSPFVRSYLAQAHPRSLDKSLLTIAFAADQADQLDLVDNAKNRAVIQTTLKELGAGDLQVKFVKLAPETGPRATPAPAPTAASAPTQKARLKPAAAPAPEPKAGAPAPPPLNLDEFKNDPLIKQALEIFKGQIVNVKT